MRLRILLLALINIAPLLALLFLAWFLFGLPSVRVAEPQVVPFDQKAAIQHLTDENWKEAGNLYYFRTRELRASIDQLRYSEKGDPAKQDRFRYRLLTFLFLNQQHSFPRWLIAADELNSLSKEYLMLRQRLPESERTNELDFSHLPLMQDVLSQVDTWPRSDAKVSPDTKERILRALQTNPDSGPAIMALMLFLHRDQRQHSRNLEEWREAKAALSGSFGKLTLARATADLGDRFRKRDPYFVIDILEQGWQCAYSAEEKAGILIQLSNEYDRSPKPRERTKAVATTQKVIDDFSATHACAGALQLRTRILIEMSGPDRALQSLEQTENEQGQFVPGLSSARFQVAAAFVRQERYDDGETLLLGLLQVHDGTAIASHAMLELARLYKQRGEVAQYVDWLDRCARYFPEQDSPRGIGIERYSSADSREAANQALAEWHEAQGNWFRAYFYWRDWQPHSWCGLGQDALCRQRSARMQRCLMQSFAASWYFWLTGLVGFCFLTRTTYRQLKKQRLMDQGAA